MIIVLGYWVYSTYLNDFYFQSYVNSLSPILVPMVSVAFGVSSATVATFLYFGMRRVRQAQEAEEAPRRKPQPRRPAKKIQVTSGSKPTKAEAARPLGVPRPRFVITPTAPATDAALKPGNEKKESK